MLCLYLNFQEVASKSHVVMCTKYLASSLNVCIDLDCVHERRQAFDLIFYSNAEIPKTVRQSGKRI